MVEESVGEVGFCVEYCVVIGNCSCEIVKFEVGEGVVVECVGIVWLYFEGLFVIGECFL